MDSKEQVKNVFGAGRPDMLPVYDLLSDRLDLGREMDINLLEFETRAMFPERDKFNMLAMRDPFQALAEKYGLENLLFEIGRDPGAVSRELKTRHTQIMDTALVILKDYTGEIDGVWLWSDMAHKRGTFFSDTFYREHIFPIHRQMCGMFAEMSLPVVLHSDGNLNAIFPMLLEAGFKGFHPLESAAGMDPVLLKKYGSGTVFFGNVGIDALESGDMDGVRAAVTGKMEALKDLRYVFGFESPVPDSVEPGRYAEVIDFVREYSRDNIFSKL